MSADRRAARSGAAAPARALAASGSRAGAVRVDARLLRDVPDRAPDRGRRPATVVTRDLRGSGVGAFSVHRIRTVVDFPAPFGPSSTSTSSLRTASEPAAGAATLPIASRALRP